LCEQTTKTGGVLLIFGWFCGKEILQYFCVGSPTVCCCSEFAATPFYENSRIITIEETT
jgi:hypothetical protein